MTTVADFDIATDLKVEFYLAGGGTNDFVIGVSKIGGSNVLAGAGWFYIGSSLIGGDDVLTEGSAFEWTDLACSTSKAQLSIGGSVKDYLYFQPQPASANVTLQTWTNDPAYSPAFRPGVKMRIRVEKDAVDEVIWQGIVDTITSDYDVDGNNLIQVTGQDSFKKLMNTRLDLFDSDTDFPEGFVSPYEQLELIAEQFGTNMNASSEDPGGEIPSTILEDFIPTQLVYEAIQVGLGIFWIDPATEEFVIIPRTSAASIPEGTPIIGNHHEDPNHLCMTDIQTRLSEDVVYNSVKVILESDTGISVIRENQDSIDLYGKYAEDVTLNTTDLDELNRWADAVFTQTTTSPVESVGTKALDRESTLTEAAFMLPGQPIGVHFSEDVLEIDEYYTVTKVSHNIDVNNWFTTLELWKE